MNQLKEPAEYLVKLEALRKVNRYAKRWTLRLESHTNRHPECSGRSWGWYEIHPLGIEVGFWGSDKDDLKGVDIAAWNEEAERISRATNDQGNGPRQAQLAEGPR